MAKPFLEHDVGLDLVQRDMSGAFHHDLHACLPRPQGEFTQCHKLFDLGRVCGISAAAGPETVTEADGDIVLLEDLEHLVVSD